MVLETAELEFETPCAQFGTARLEFGTAYSEFRTAHVEFGSARLELGRPTHPTADGCLMLSLVGPSLLGCRLFNSIGGDS
jgi:hypothetical protein